MPTPKYETDHKKIPVSVRPMGNEANSSSLEGEIDMELQITLRIPYFGRYQQVTRDMKHMVRVLDLAGYLPTKVDVVVEPVKDVANVASAAAALIRRMRNK